MPEATKSRIETKRQRLKAVAGSAEARAGLIPLIELAEQELELRGPILKEQITTASRDLKRLERNSAQMKRRLIESTKAAGELERMSIQTKKGNKCKLQS